MKGTIIWFAIISLFLGFIVGGVIIGNIFPSTIKITDTILCDGEMSVINRAYSYKPGQSGVEHIVKCTDPASGEVRTITGAAVTVYSLMFSLAIFILLWINRLIRKLRGKPVIGDVVSPTPPAQVGRASAAPPAAPSGFNPAKDSALQALTELKKLRDAELISELEYQDKKAEILAKL